eukprot:TRINITY_DN13545_c0_g1_i1.p3 TRINITY_DN13545_c0_g1~~TRINITY_DN13545_c0_g1_i1.p3  ORF type:complete len:224 (-),score=42.67 TRINITY_DN13545_c0_g1_i1:88-759(-)
MIRRPPRSTLSSSSAASDVYKRQYQRRVHGLKNKPQQQSYQLKQPQYEFEDDRILKVKVDSCCQRNVNASSNAVEDSEKIDNAIFSKNNSTVMYKKKLPQYRKKYGNIACLNTDTKIDRIVQQLQNQKEHFPNAIDNAERAYLEGLENNKLKKQATQMQNSLLAIQNTSLGVNNNNNQEKDQISRMQSNDQLQVVQPPGKQSMSQIHSQNILQSMKSISMIEK